MTTLSNQDIRVPMLPPEPQAAPLELRLLQGLLTLKQMVPRRLGGKRQNCNVMAMKFSHLCTLFVSSDLRKVALVGTVGALRVLY